MWTHRNLNGSSDLQMEWGKLKFAGMRVAFENKNQENQERESQRHMHLGVWEKQFGFYAFLGQYENTRMWTKQENSHPCIWNPGAIGMWPKLCRHVVSTNVNNPLAALKRVTFVPKQNTRFQLVRMTSQFCSIWSCLLRLTQLTIIYLL